MQQTYEVYWAFQIDLNVAQTERNIQEELQDGGRVRRGDHLPPQIHEKYIYVWNNPYRTPTERRQKNSDLPKGKKLPMYLGRAKEKRKNRDKRIGTGSAPVGGSCEGGKVSTH